MFPYFFRIRLSSSSKNPTVNFEGKGSRQMYRIGWVQGLTPVIAALWESEVGVSFEVRCLRAAWPTRCNPTSTKNTKINLAWWHAPIIPATQEAEAGKSLEPGRRRLQ